MKRLLILMAAVVGCVAARADSVRDSVLTVTEPLTELKYAERADFHTVVFASRPAVIPAYAFRECPNLREVRLPESVCDIKSQAFVYCRKLQSINLPDGMTHIGANVFSFCTSLREVKLPANLKELESYAFSECTSLRRVTMPANANLLGEMLFAGCYALTELIEPSPVPPPFDCNSQPFDPEERGMLRTCTLRVPAMAVPAYRQARAWGEFERIEPM